ncbi:MAG: hypothetical protein HFG29_11200 [Eubacterium sp.]|nr:hypothetical protein [Clostridia bacterium]MCI8957508.1 hypothetical protein [Eubacterium sp.]
MGKINFDAISDMTVNERISAAINRLSENDIQYDETSSRLIEYYSNIMMDILQNNKNVAKFNDDMIDYFKNIFDIHSKELRAVYIGGIIDCLRALNRLDLLSFL